MANILVVDDDSIIREPIAAALRGQGHNVVSADHGDTALARIKSNVPDLILLDIRMPHRDGISLLKELRSDPKTEKVPVLLLSSTTEKSQILQAAKLGVQGYILKSSFNLKLLLDRIEELCRASPVPCIRESLTTSTAQGAFTASLRSQPIEPPLPPKTRIPPSVNAKPPGKSQSAGAPAARRSADPIAPEDVPRLLSREETLRRLDQIAAGKTIAGVVARLISVANSPEADLTDVVKVIQGDPVLAARVLQLASAAATGSTGRVRSVEDAARNLGMRGIQNMAISIGVFGVFPPDERNGFSTMRCWQHSYAVAELLNLLLRQRNPEQESLNHLVGLCHDMGEILLRQYFVAEFEQILEFSGIHKLPIHEVQGAALGVRHPELVSRLLSRIGLPVPVVQAIREFFERQMRGQSSGIGNEAHGLTFANLAAHGLLLAASTHEEVRPITKAEWRQFDSHRPWPVIDHSAKRADYLVATNVMARLPANEEQRLLVPIIPHRALKVCYTRPPNFIEFDPLAMALSFLCDVSITQECPAAAELEQYDALVRVGLRASAFDMTKLARPATSNATAIPTLNLVGEEIAPAISARAILRSFPISLQDIAAWLESAGKP